MWVPLVHGSVMDLELEKQRAAEAAVKYVEDGMLVGLGTGTTVAHLLTALAARYSKIRCFSRSPRT
jgi:ribose 5-phosphate isomerase A